MGANKPGNADDRPVINVADAGHLITRHPDRCEGLTPDDDEDEEAVELSLEDEGLVRATFAAALAEAIGDRGLNDAPSRSRRDRAQLVEVMRTDLHGREIEELHFIALTFGLAASIELDPMLPEGHEGRVTVSLTANGGRYV